MICAWCEQTLCDADRPIRLSTTQPPVRSRHVLTAVGAGFAAIIHAARGEPEITLYFHPACWQNLADILPGYTSNR